MVDGALLARCALLYFVCDLKAPPMNVQSGLIWDIMLDEFDLGYRSKKKNCCTKGEGAVDLVGFYGISTIVGYLMLNPLYTYIY